MKIDITREEVAEAVLDGFHIERTPLVAMHKDHQMGLGFVRRDVWDGVVQQLDVVFLEEDWMVVSLGEESQVFHSDAFCFRQFSVELVLSLGVGDVLVEFSYFFFAGVAEVFYFEVVGEDALL